MIFGHNTNVKLGGATYHVQTEDRGVASALIDTTVYCHGRVMHRRTNTYSDLLPLDAKREEALRLRLDEQHRKVMEAMLTGALQLAVPVATAAATQPTLTVELVNAKTWLAGKRATLHIAVGEKESGKGLAGAQVAAKIEGAETSGKFETKTGAEGKAQLEFEMPRLSGKEPALVIEARSGEARGNLRFQLRARPRGPSA